jgi:hypothetical protein
MILFPSGLCIQFTPFRIMDFPGIRGSGHSDWLGSATVYMKEKSKLDTLACRQSFAQHWQLNVNSWSNSELYNITWCSTSSARLRWCYRKKNLGPTLVLPVAPTPPFRSPFHPTRTELQVRLPLRHIITELNPVLDQQASPIFHRT